MIFKKSLDVYSDYFNKEKSWYSLIYCFQEKELANYGVWLFFIGTSLPPPCVNWLMEQPIGLDHHCGSRNLKHDYFKDTVYLIKVENFLNTSLKDVFK